MFASNIELTDKMLKYFVNKIIEIFLQLTSAKRRFILQYFNYNLNFLIIIVVNIRIGNNDEVNFEP